MQESHDIVDIGVNLAHRSFQGDRKQIVERAFAAGVRTMVITGTSGVGSQEGVRIAWEYRQTRMAIWAKEKVGLERGRGPNHWVRASPARARRSTRVFGSRG